MTHPSKRSSKPHHHSSRSSKPHHHSSGSKKTGSGLAPDVQVDLVKGVAGMAFDAGAALYNNYKKNKTQTDNHKYTVHFDKNNLPYRIGSNGYRRYDINRHGYKL